MGEEEVQLLTGAGAVLALVLLEWTAGSVVASGWSQSWSVITRGHFRIVGWTAALLAVLLWFSNASAIDGLAADTDLQRMVVGTLIGICIVYLVVQYSRTDVPGVVVAVATGIVALIALFLTSDLIEGWPQLMAFLQLVSGTVLLGAVTNGMLLGHWYLNQPGLKPWALARLTDLCLAGVGASALLGLIGAGRLSDASTEGAVLGIPGFGESFSLAFYLVWLGLVLFTGGVVWAARRCVQIKSIQSATGLFYVALLTAGVAEFLVRYLMVNAS